MARSASPSQHVEVRKRMDADNIVAWEAPEVGVPGPWWVFPAQEGIPSLRCSCR